MAQQHDLFDDIIDISKGIGAFKDPFAGLSDALMGNGGTDAPEWNPAEYKERPRANSIPCLACKSDKSSCRKCIDVCPVNAIQIEDGGIDIADSCRKCGLCVAVCPTEAFNSPKIKPKELYDKIAGAAAAHETAYVACTRALRRPPRDNEVVVACVGDVPAETWFSVMVDYPNVSVYLPLDICTKCRNAQGEELLGDAIATAEEWSGRSMGLEVDRKALKCNKRREYERKEFMDNIVKSTGLTVSKLNPATAALMSVTQKLKAHNERISKLNRTLEQAVGVTNQKRRRVLTQRRQLMLSALQQHPKRAKAITHKTPECDFERCVECGECVSACPMHACDLNGAGRFVVEPTHCIGCGLCAEVCDTHALKLVEHDAQDLVVADPDAEKKAAEAKKAHEDAEKLKAEAKKKLTKALDQVEKLAD